MPQVGGGNTIYFDTTLFALSISLSFFSLALSLSFSFSFSIYLSIYLSLSLILFSIFISFFSISIFIFFSLYLYFFFSLSLLLYLFSTPLLSVLTPVPYVLQVTDPITYASKGLFNDTCSVNPKLSSYTNHVEGKRNWAKMYV